MQQQKTPKPYGVSFGVLGVLGKGKTRKGNGLRNANSVKRAEQKTLR